METLSFLGSKTMLQSPIYWHCYAEYWCEDLHGVKCYNSIRLLPVQTSNQKCRDLRMNFRAMADEPAELAWFWNIQKNAGKMPLEKMMDSFAWATLTSRKEWPRVGRYRLYHPTLTSERVTLECGANSPFTTVYCEVKSTSCFTNLK